MIKRLFCVLACTLLIASNASAATVYLDGPVEVEAGQSFQLSIFGDFEDGLLAGGIQLLYDPALVQFVSFSTPLNVDPDLSCPGAALCPVDPAGTLSLVWGQFLTDLMPTGSSGVLMGELTFQATGPGTAAFFIVDFSSFTGGWFGAGFVSIPAPDFVGLSVQIKEGVIDSDGDGVADDGDFCPSTVIPESLPTRTLGVNRFALVDSGDTFDTAEPRGKGPSRSYTTSDTAGCSCTQIIEALSLGTGHVKFGCSISAMDDWVEFVTP